MLGGRRQQAAGRMDLAGRPPPRISEIVAEYRHHKLREELLGDWVIGLLYRVPSFGLVWLFSRLGLSATAVTLLAGLLAVSLPLLAWLPPLPAAGWLVLLAASLFQMLDCVDGAIARLTGTASEVGGRIDFLTDMAQWALLYGSIGLLADRHFGDGFQWTAMAMAAAWLRLYARVIRDAWAVPGRRPVKRPIRPAELPAIAFAGLSGAIPFLAIFGSALDIAVWLLIAYSLLDIGDSLVGSLMRKAK